MPNGIRIEGPQSDDGMHEFHDFDSAVMYAEASYGYEGELWEMVKLERDWEELSDFLYHDGIEQELIEEEN